MTKKKITFSLPFKYDAILAPFYGIILPGAFIHGVLEFYASGFSFYFFRDVFNTFITIVAFILFGFGIINKRNLITISVYSILFSILFTFVLGIFDSNFIFEPFFLQAQILILVLSFAISMLVHYNKAIYIFIFNIIFIIFCYVTTGQEYSVIKFIYYAIIVCGASLISYVGQRRYVLLSKKMKIATKINEEQNEKLKSMNTSKDQLLRIIGHDLRTPFHQVNLLIGMIAETKNQTERKELEYLIKEASQNGNQILEDLLTWGEKYREQSEIILEKQSITEIIYRVFEFSDFGSRAKKIRLINNVDPDLKLNINTAMTETILRNLIANAIKFSHPKSNIIVASEKVEKGVLISVQDCGIGMCQEVVDNLFSKDKNKSTFGTADEKGTGYGLNISKRLMERQKGTLKIYSVPDNGTIANLFFPM